ncbi:MULTISPECIES: ABC transporter ATP-binding protein/permease [unclassified Ruminococcus]|uniref:ABC transporter ATP-binding protein/permease n=1 Tax=unclassified Ruminococcus TaxID=2608920 RepID=UPI002108E45E|nr:MULTISPECIES: ABC transporter ATP-binding protein/permease [unclassified Ruminococcus]MCQ4021556.1 ATP-binding cassette domain-containing protein [Ruminococcus sp. zg-924]MCQ4114001.1 ATP-binding cassette domain-containing protein [Ruminococcus sp. zg-921]
MLQVKNIHKEYKTGNLVQKALDDVSLNLRDNEFVAILGPSGSGKTTLLNIIGGLDRYDSGELIINGISTKKYKDRDWDSYRNHTIGFVFQSYNLIPHQTVLANVELALTISGISKAERRKRATEALEQVGLGEQLHKRPSQMSGGQMQRVAIARALVNNPDILLADEPTGALDSETSVAVMELLKEVAKDRLVVMVTHNPELADDYATRIVRLQDGKIRSDSDPFEIEEETLEEPEHRNMGKSSMSFLTALSLSFNNLRTKKARTLLTSFAGSIGIIGIALILALSNGVNLYIKSIEEDTLSEYPLQIQSTGIDITSMMVGPAGSSIQGGEGEVGVTQMVTNMFSKMNSNDLQSLKLFLESEESGIDEYTNAIEYSYDISPQIFREDKDGIKQVNPDKTFSALGLGAGAGANSIMSTVMSTDVFHEMPENEKLYQNQYEVKAGHWPEKYNECVLVLTGSGNMSDYVMYAIGLRDSAELDDMIESFISEEDVEAPSDIRPFSYDEILGTKFKLVYGTDYYEYDKEYEVWKDKSGDKEYMKKLVNNGEDMTIVGIVQPAAGTTAAMLRTGIGYPASLTNKVIEQASSSKIVKQQLKNPGINVFTGDSFGTESDRDKFKLDSLFKINTDELKKAFSFSGDMSNMDMSKLLSFNSAIPDMSGMLDLSEIKLDMPELEGMSLADIMGDFEISVSEEDMSALFGGLMNGYKDYVADNPAADMSGLGESFAQYLVSEQGRQRLLENLKVIVQNSCDMVIGPDQVEQMVSNIMAGYQEYAAANNLTDPEKFNEYLFMYLKTDDAKQRLSDNAANIKQQISAALDLFPEQLKALASDMMAGYCEYAAQNSLPDPSRLGEFFADYLNTPEAQRLINDGITKIASSSDLEKQVSAALEKSMSSFTGAISTALQGQITSAMQQIMTQISTNMQSSMQQAMSSAGTEMGDGLSVDGDAFKKAVQTNMNEEELTELMMSMMSSEDSSYDGNMKKFGYADMDKPTGISIYPIDFDGKAKIIEALDSYNSRMEKLGEDEKIITYTDMVGSLMSSVTTIIDIVSYVLVAFVAISLIVSSIMIGVITYISVLERKKEIGILRAIGASKRNVSQVFNAETFIIGLCAGLLGIGISLVMIVIANAIIHAVSGMTNLYASLPLTNAAVLVLLSVVLTLIGGLIPSRKAAKNDPVTALRTE